MLRKNVWMVLVLVSIFLPSSLLAQEMMHGKWWQNKTMAAQLELSDSERSLLDEKYAESRRRFIDLKSEVERERLELDILLESKEANMELISERYNSLEKARTKLSRERFALLIEIRDIIGVERFQELKSMHHERYGDRDRRKRQFRDRDR